MIWYIAMAGLGGIAWGRGWKWWGFLPVAVSYGIEYLILLNIIEDSSEYQRYGTYPAVYDGVIYAMWAVGIIVCIWMVRRGRGATGDANSKERGAYRTDQEIEQAVEERRQKRPEKLEQHDRPRVYAVRDTPSKQEEADESGSPLFCQHCAHKRILDARYCEQCGYEFA